MGILVVEKNCGFVFLFSEYTLLKSSLFCVLGGKRYAGLKKYTTAGGGGGDLYEQWTLDRTPLILGMGDVCGLSGPRQPMGMYGGYLGVFCIS